MQEISAVTLRFVLIEKDGNAPEDMTLGDAIVIDLDRSKPVIVGKAPNVDVVLSAPSVGRRVIMLSLEPDGIWVRDLGSGGGSSVEIDGVITHRPDCRCPDQALLRIGRVAFRVELQDGRLFDAAWTGDRSTIERLLREGCKPTGQRDGLTPLHLASVNGFADAASALIEAGALVDAEAWPDLACLEWGMAAFKKWSANPDPTRVFEEGPPRTVRDEWWRKVSARTRRLFIGESERGALGCTPLHLACDGGHVEMVSLLIAHGSDPYSEVYLDGGPEGFWEWTPMELARGQLPDSPHAKVLKVLENYMRQHPQSEASRSRQKRRHGLIPG